MYIHMYMCMYNYIVMYTTYPYIYIYLFSRAYIHFNVCTCTCVYRHRGMHQDYDTCMFLHSAQRAGEPLYAYAGWTGESRLTLRSQ